jgi:alpha-L-rhamnosidase
MAGQLDRGDAIDAAQPRRIFSIVVSLLLAARYPVAGVESPVRLYDLTCEHLVNPIGIGKPQPRLSWKLRSDRLGEVQTAYQIRAASSRARLEAQQADLWNSGKIGTDQSVLVRWNGAALGSRAQVFWQVRVWDKDGSPSPWSSVGSFELGLLDPKTEWQGKWITADLPRYDLEASVLSNAFWINAGSTANQAAAVRFVLNLPRDEVVRAAVIDATADGRITIYINGQATRQGASSRTAPLHADIRGQLVPGRNVIAIGSAAVRTAVRKDRNESGRNAVCARGLIELKGGKRLELNTGESWKAAVAPEGDWFARDFNDFAWPSATTLGRYIDQPSRYCDNTLGPGRYLRRTFIVKTNIAKARLYATALGVYEASLNGHRVGDRLLDPGWTDYTKRVMVQTFDVTQLLVRGTNCLGAVIGDGWYAGRLGWMGLAQYGTRPVFAAQLEISYADGTRDVIATDESWRAGPGEIIGSDAQWGEIIDARKTTGWNQPGFDDSAWTKPVIEQHHLALDPQRGPPVRALFELEPQRITRRSETWIADFGQNLVGYVRLSARGAAGTAITVRHAEMLGPNGAVYTENLRPALATDTFILQGNGHETFEPHFTFHGFRYVELTGYPGDLARKDLRAIVVSSDTPGIGTWESSNPDLNRLYSNIVWSQRGNFLSVPTDCPQRDERMGWMGDAQVFAPTAVCNADVAAFFDKWMVDVNDGQNTRGDFGNVSPRIGSPQPGWPVWGDAGVIVPWVLFNAYGDEAFLADNYSHMTRWLDYCAGAATNHILRGGVGDHLAPQRTPTEVVDTAYFANSARIVAKSAAILGKGEDSAKYTKMFHEIRDAFNAAFVATNGVVRGDTQTGSILALRFDLLPPELRSAVAHRLAAYVEQAGHLTTGFVGNGLICPTLTDLGRSDLAWDLVLTNSYPSWLFSVKNGATTIWERWDGWTPEHGYQDSSMNSFNHYSLGSVGAWLYSGAAGIELDETHPGYKHFRLKPQFTSRLSSVKASLDSPYGLISLRWQIRHGQIQYDVTIPPNTSAELMLPVPPRDIRQSGHPIPQSAGQVTRLLLAAGSYDFSLPGGR